MTSPMLYEVLVVALLAWVAISVAIALAALAWDRVHARRTVRRQRLVEDEATAVARAVDVLTDPGYARFRADAPVRLQERRARAFRTDGGAR